MIEYYKKKEKELDRENKDYDKILKDDHDWYALNIERIKNFGEPPVEQLYNNEDAST